MFVILYFLLNLCDIPWLYSFIITVIKINTPIENAKPIFTKPLHNIGRGRQNTTHLQMSKLHPENLIPSWIRQILFEYLNWVKIYIIFYAAGRLKAPFSTFRFVIKPKILGTRQILLQFPPELSCSGIFDFAPQHTTNYEFIIVLLFHLMYCWQSLDIYSINRH